MAFAIIWIAFSSIFVIIGAGLTFGTLFGLITQDTGDALVVGPVFMLMGGVFVAIGIILARQSRVDRTRPDWPQYISPARTEISSNEKQGRYFYSGFALV